MKPILALLALASCSRICPEKVKTVNVVVEKVKTCTTTPPPGSVPLYEPRDAGCPDNFDACVGPDGSAALAAIYTWMVTTWAACGPTESTPPSSPSPPR